MPLPTRSHQDPATLIIPAERLYWALVQGDAGGARRSGAALPFAFEAWVPQAIDEVECRFVQLPVMNGSDRATGLVLACGIDRAALRSLIDEAESSGGAVESVRPGELPACIRGRLPEGAEWGGLAGQIEFRSGPFDSPRRLRHRRRVSRVLAGSGAATALLVCAAMLVDASRQHVAAESTRRATRTMIAQALGLSKSIPGAGTVDPVLRLAAEVRRLEQTHDRAASAVLPEDRLATFVGLLASWPTEFPARVDSLQIDQEQIGIRGMVRDPLDYERLAAAVKPLNTAVPALSGGAGAWSSPSGSTTAVPPSGPVPNGTTVPPTTYSYSLSMHRDLAPPGSSPGTTPTPGTPPPLPTGRPPSPAPTSTTPSPARAAP